MKIARMALLVLLAVSVNLSTGAFLYMGFDEKAPEWAATLCIGAFLAAMVLTVACILFAVVAHERTFQHPADQKGLGIPVAVVKFLMIPFFLMVAFLIVIYFLATLFMVVSVWFMIPGIFAGLSGVVLLPIAVVVCYLLVAATSAFSLSAIIIEYRKGTIKQPTAIIFGILQFIPAVDMISYPFMVGLFKSRNKTADQQALQLQASEEKPSLKDVRWNRYAR